MVSAGALRKDPDPADRISSVRKSGLNRAETPEPGRRAASLSHVLNGSLDSLVLMDTVSGSAAWGFGRSHES